MELQSLDLLDWLYLSLNNLVKTLNTFASFQEYTIIKKHTKVSKKWVLCKLVLIYDRSKKHINEKRDRRDTTSQKKLFY